MVKMNELFLKKPKVLSKLVLSSPSFIEPFFHLLTDFNHRSIFGKVKFTSVSRMATYGSDNGRAIRDVQGRGGNGNNLDTSMTCI